MIIGSYNTNPPTDYPTDSWYVRFTSSRFLVIALIFTIGKQTQTLLDHSAIQRQVYAIQVMSLEFKNATSTNIDSQPVSDPC